MEVRHIQLADANAFVQEHHRHHKAVRGHRFSIACYDGDRLCGVAIVGRPVARGFDYKATLEVLRLCTDGTRNACSFLYGAARRCAKALGYDSIITYILQDENGQSVRATGYVYVHTTSGGSWDCPSRRRTDKAPTCRKKLYASRCDS